jgi:hypothetical protein
MGERPTFSSRTLLINQLEKVSQAFRVSVPAALYADQILAILAELRYTSGNGRTKNDTLRRLGIVPAEELSIIPGRRYTAMRIANTQGLESSYTVSFISSRFRWRVIGGEEVTVIGERVVARAQTHPYLLDFGCTNVPVPRRALKASDQTIVRSTFTAHNDL